jgi:hypothetical protein
MRKILSGIAVLAVVACAGFLNGCTNTNVEGNTYLAGGGAISIEFKSGGKATMTGMGESQQCTYTQNAKQVSMTCPGDRQPVVFTVNDDGSLAPPQGSLLPPFTKKK